MNQATTNQYAPPLADVADIPSDTGVSELKLFSHRSRIGRLRYLAYATVASVVHSIVSTVLLIGLTGSQASLVVSVVAFAALFWFNVITGIKRCHDMNISGWWCATLIVPVIALAWIFWPGTRGTNRFGPPPPPNGWGVRILGLILPVVFFTGMIAAIAIPQYKMYVDKARAAQAAQPR